jgi:hypothetical protein
MYLDSIFSPQKEKKHLSDYLLLLIKIIISWLKPFLLFPYLDLFYYSYIHNVNKNETLFPFGGKFLMIAKTSFKAIFGS